MQRKSLEINLSYESFDSEFQEDQQLEKHLIVV